MCVGDHPSRGNGLFRPDAFHGIRRCHPPALDDDGKENDCADDAESQGEYPPMNGGVCCKLLQPLPTDAVANGGLL